MSEYVTTVVTNRRSRNKRRKKKKKEAIYNTKRKITKVIFDCPVLHPFKFLHSSSNPGPAALRIHPSTTM